MGLDVAQVQGKERRRQPPLPLSTLEMQKKATQSLHMPGERIMKVAEDLYQSGFISYPRTETDSFSPGMDLMVSQLCFSLMVLKTNACYLHKQSVSSPNAICLTSSVCTLMLAA